MDELNSTMQQPTAYDDDDIKTLDWMEHIRRRPGMYIGKLGDGSYADDGIYVLLKEVLDNSIDEYMMGYGKTIEVTVEEGTVSVRDYGRGVPLGKVVDVSSKMNTGAKYDSKAFKKSERCRYQGGECLKQLFPDHQPPRRRMQAGGIQQGDRDGRRSYLPDGRAERDTDLFYSGQGDIQGLPVQGRVHREPAEELCVPELRIDNHL